MPAFPQLPKLLTRENSVKNGKLLLSNPYLKMWPGSDKQELQTNIKPTLHFKTCGKMHAQTTPGLL